ncbi:peptidoglycan DD-metalloendopeptidase family protein [Lysinibacillus pakistanensis]|uniref:Peptidoglycan DD-metalloendopeptidase family protein n=1 Tax=Lysinibacillus pakistanensis TaxID=759811 RepID=A0AAX3WZK3_9BACI|nr:peptidoglycan DD-metalloendopeptidase family protein [Lysinibacillus pakistanensis]MDM5232591.1 peptidoglycan DD-metalloendopeptidase family protein [Lysinibacillus pakistanensis]WHY48097.1 peptidoglycan DD-metalloendopeptidase family protein [Lysinibacillus pakistanensis]WHY53109.1 peptidoglycan DD-metalloendopeptidase family protein [Lysinibacillus pakistanensis]
MSTGGGQTKPIELLAALGINDDISRKNIQTYIKRLKNIPAIKMSLDVKGPNTQILIEFEKQLQALEQQLQSVNQKYQEIGSGSTPSLSFFDELKKQITHSVKSINTLSQAFGDANINVSKFYKQLAKTPAGDLRTLENIVSKLKTEVETISFNHIQFGGIQETLANLQSLESNLYTIYELNKAYADTADFEQLTSQITDLNTQLSNIQLGEGLNIAGLSDIPQQLEKINQGIEAFGKNTAAAAQSATFSISTITSWMGQASTFKTFAEDIAGIELPKKAIRGFNIAGIVLGFSEFAIGEFSKHKEKAKQKLEELKTEEHEILNAYTSNAKEIDGIVNKYAQLEKSMALGNADPTVLAEYQDISNQLGELLPNIVAHEDEYGNKIIGSSEALKVKIELLKEQQALEAQMAEQEAKEKRDENIDTRKGAISDLKDKQKTIAQNAAIILDSNMASNILNNEKFSDDNGKPLLKTAADFEKKLNEIKKLQSIAEKSGDNDLVNYYQQLSNDVNHFMEEIADNEAKLNQKISAQKSDYISNLAYIINENDKLTDSLKNTAEGFAAQLIDVTDVKDLDTLQNSLTALFSNENASTLINDVIGSFQNMENATTETFDSMASSAKDKLSNVRAELTGLGFSEEVVSSIMKSLNLHYDDTIATQKKLSVEMKTNNLTLAEAKEKMFGYNKEAEKFTTIYEQLAGVSQKKVNDTSDLLFQYQMLTNQLKDYSEEEIRNLSRKGNLTAEEQRLVNVMHTRNGVINSLNSNYPTLLDNDGKAIKLNEEKIKAIEAENKANETLLNGYKLARDGKLTADQEMLLSSTQVTKLKIQNIKRQIMMLEYYVKANEITSKIIGQMNGLLGIGLVAQQLVVENNIRNYKKELNGLTMDFDSNIAEIDGFTTSIESSKKASKSSNTATKDSIYITDTFKKSLENLNSEIEKQVKIQSTFPKHSDEYRNSLQAQLKLERDKLNLLENQEKSLKSQISSGKINKTGTVSGNTSTTTSSTKLNGWSGKITSNFGNRILNGKKDFHLGVDIDGTKGQRLDAPVSGTVIKSGYAGNNKEDSTYGNIVMIKDDSGIKHLFAHMEKTLVKIGDNVTAGTQIGTIGNSGFFTKGGGDGSHLHYEVRKNDKAINPMDYLNNAKSSTVRSTNYTAIDTSQQAIDQATSELNSLSNNILQQKLTITDLEKRDLDTSLDKFDRKRSVIDANLSHEEEKIKLVDKSSDRYTKTLDLQTKYLEQKQAVNQQELEFLEKITTTKGLNSQTVEEYSNRMLELKTEMHSVNSALGEMSLAYLDVYEAQRKTEDSKIELESSKLKELDSNSNAYIQTLQSITSHMEKKQAINKNELKYLEAQIKSSKYSGEILEQLKDKYAALTVQIQDLSVELRHRNYEIIINLQTRFDEKIKEKEFKLQQSKIIQSMYETVSDSMTENEAKVKELERSGDVLKELNSQVSLLNGLREDINNQIIITQNQLRSVELNPDDIKALKEDLQNYNLELKNKKSEILKTETQIESKIIKQKKDLAETLIKVYKDYIQEQKDAVIRQYELETEAENKRHENIMKNIDDERNKFREAIEERLRLIDRQEAERDYSMDIDKLEKEKNDIQRQIALLSLDDSHEAKSKRKKLEEQLFNIEEDIQEKRHDRDIELQKQSLNDLLEMKDKEIDGKSKAEDDYHNQELKRIDDLKSYWEQHYNDLLNDERKFAQIREDIVSGNFENLRLEFGGFIDWLETTMPELGNTLDGTMKAVGLTIRQNIIDTLKEAMNLMTLVQNSSIPTGIYGSSADNDSSYQNSSQNSKLTLGDMQVLLGKYLTDKLALQVDNPIRAANIREKAHILASQGRENGSEIKATDSFDSIINSLSKSDLTAFSKFLESNATVVMTPEYQEKIKDLAKQYYLAGMNYSPDELPQNTNSTSQIRHLSDADFKVIMGKYMTDVLASNATPVRAANIREKAHTIAKAGRREGSSIETNSSYNAEISKLSNEDLVRLSNFVMKNYTIFDSTEMQNELKNWAKLLLGNKASALHGGMTKWSGNGIDGKGGKEVIVHPNELINSPIDTKRLLDMANIMERAANFFTPMIHTISNPTSLISNVASMGGDTYEFNFDIGEMIANKTTANNFAKDIWNDLRVKKGVK